MAYPSIRDLTFALLAAWVMALGVLQYDGVSTAAAAANSLDILPTATVALPLPTATLPSILPTATIPVVTPTATLPAVLPTATVEVALPTATLALPTATLALPTATLALPTATLPLPTATLAVPTATLEVALPTTTLTLPTATLALPTATLEVPLPTTTLALPTATLEVALPTSTLLPVLPTATLPSVLPTATLPIVASTATPSPTSTSLVGGQNFALTSLGGGVVALSWDPGVAQTGYALVRISARGDTTVLALPQVAAGYVDVPPTNQRAFCYALRVLQGSSTIASSDVLCVLTRLGIGSAAASFSVRLNESRGNLLRWAPPGGQTGYVLLPVTTDRAQLLSDSATSATDATGGVLTCYVLVTLRGGAVAGFTDAVCA